jgi:hypothetical protein
MRQLVAVTLLSCCISSAYAAPRCDMPIEFPADFMVCNDPQLAALDEEVDTLHREAGNLAARHGLQDSQTLRRAIENKCALPGFIDVRAALRSRACVVADYADQIKKTAAVVGPRGDRLRGRPADLNPTNTYFTILGYHDTLDEAQNDIARLKAVFPFEEFALFPPNPSTKHWAIVFSSYVDEPRADRARDLAVALGISPTPQVLRLPDPPAIGRAPCCWGCGTEAIASAAAGF